MDDSLSRRRFLRYSIAAASAGGSLTQAVAAQNTGTGSWSEFGHGPNNSGYSPDSGVSGHAASQRWILSTADVVSSGISVVDRTVYFTDVVGRVYRVTDDGGTSTFNIGASQDSRDEDLPTSTPAVGTDRLYIGGLSQEIVSIDRTTGEEQWTVTTDAEVRSSPVLSDGSLYVSDADGEVYRVSTDTGEINWTYSADDTVYTSPVVSQGFVYVLTQEGGFHRVDSSTGDGEQTVGFDGTVEASPVSDGNRVYTATTEGEVSAVSDGVDWGVSLGESVVGTPAVADGVVYIGTEQGSVTAVSASSGERLWSVDIDGGVQRGVAVADETLIAGTDEGSAYAIDTTEEEILWEYSAGTEITTPISVADGILYFGGVNGQVFAVEAESGLLNRFVGAVTSGDVGGAYGAIDDAVPRAAQGVVAVGFLGLVVYAAARRFRGDEEGTERQPASSGTSTSPHSASSRSSSPALSGDATRISESPAESEESIGASVSGAGYEDFEQIERIGSGGNADVYKSRHRGNESVVALKIPRIADDETIDTSTFSEFVNEAEVWGGIDDHERIVSVYAWGDQPLPWIAVEYMDGGTLGAQRLDLDEVYAELEGFCEALHHAHRQGVTHTDIKPENILYRDVNGRQVGKLTDWGLANELLEHSNSVAGFTPEYSAPEQLRPEEYGGTDERTDIYQLGVVAYELFTGELPYEGGSSQGASVMAVLNDEPKTPSELNPGLDEGLDDVLMKVLSKKKEHRYETALHFRDDLRKVYDKNWG